MPRHHSHGDGLERGSYFTLPDGRGGRVGRCRFCGAEVVYAADEHGRTPPYDLDGVKHTRTCADGYDEPRRNGWAES